MSTQIASAESFVAALELESIEPAARPLSLEALADDASAAVDAAAVVSFVDGVSGQHKADVLNSVLLAQLAANKKYNRETDTANWYTFYRSVLEYVGWVVPAFSFSRFSTDGARFTVDGVVVKLLQAIASEQEIAVIRSAIDALKALQDRDGRVVLFETQSHSAALGNFQISTVGESADGTVVMKIGAFYFGTTETVTRVLWFNFPRSGTRMYQAAQTMTLDDDVYVRVRQIIVDKLGDRAVSFIQDLDIESTWGNRRAGTGGCRPGKAGMMDGYPRPSGSRFLAAVELGPERAPAAAQVAGGPAGVVDGASIVSFRNGVDPDHQRDALNTLLLAQLAASRKHDRYQAPRDWYAFYGSVLEQVGWVVGRQAGFAPGPPVGPRTSLPAAVAAAMRQGTSEPELSDLATTLAAFAGLDCKDRAAAVFECEGHEETLAVFQVAVVGPSPAGTAMTVGLFQWKFDGTIGSLRSAEISTDTVTFLNGQRTMTLNETVYAPLRAQVAAKLGDRPGLYVAEFAVT